MRIPFQVSAKSMQNHNETGRKVFGFIQVVEHTGDHAVYGVKETIEQRTVFEKELTKVIIKRENAMAVGDIYQFKRHIGSAFHGVFVAAGGTKAAVKTERNKLQFATVGAAVHGTTEGWITAVDHLIDIFHLSISGMKSIFNFFIIVGKDSL